MSEHQRARDWRTSRKLSVKQLSELVGWTPQSIYLLEVGRTADGQTVSEWVWQRYKRACQGVEAHLRGMEFDW